MSNKNSIRSIPPVEVASSSDTNAPVFYFNQYNQSQEYFNNRERIDFVTYEGSLYVPGAERVVPQTNDITRENFVLLVSRGPQGLPGIKGDPGRDGRTPSVFARFDGKQMIFYTNELNEDGTQKINERTGEPVIKRIAATNDLTGPSWRPKRVDDTIIWEKTRDDSQPESINLSDFVKETAPVIFRVDSDNTKRTDETSGPANYIQWKYEGDEYWNNLISISELMNLALAGVCIWFDEDDQEYHLGHRQVITATYDSSKTGKRIISDVEHGEVLYDAGPIHLPDFTADIAALWEEVCALKDRVDAIEEELPKFVKAVIINDKLNKPDEDGVVDLGAFNFYTKEESDEKFQPVGDYIKKTDLKFEIRNEEGGRFLYMSLDNGSTWTEIYEATCVCKKEEDPTVYYTIFFETPTPSTATMTYNGTVKYPGSQVRVPAGTTVVLEADAEGYKHYKETKLINADYHFAPVLTEESAPEVKYSACVIDDTELADKIYIGTTSANKQQACLENLSDGTTVRGKATRSGYKDKTVSGTINGDDLTLHITGDWTREVDEFNITEGTESNPFEICLSEGTHTFSVTPSTNVRWISNNRQYLTINENTGKATLVAVTPQYVIVRAQSTIDSSVEARCKVIIKDCTEPETTLSVSPTSLSFDKNSGDKTFTVTTNADYTVTPQCSDWITTSKSENTVTVTVTANTGVSRTCDIIVAAGDKTKTVSITQEAGEVTPPTYTVGVRNNSSCPADTMYLSLDEHDFEDHNTTLNVPSGTVVYMQAAKEGYNYQTLSHEITEDGYTFTPTCDWEWGGEFEVNGGNDININVDECVNLSELITYTPSDYVPQSITFEKGEDSYSDAISLNTETGEICGLSETSRPASVKVTINDKHLVWVNVWVGGGTHLYNLKVMEESTPGQPMPSNPEIKVYIDGVPNTYTDHALSFDVAEGTPIRVTASKEGWTANINNEDRSEYSFNMPDEDQFVIIAWTQNKYTLSVTSNTPSGAENPDVVINGVTYSDVSTTVQRQIGHGNSVNITATLSGYTPTYKDHNTGTTITIPFTMIKNTWVDIDWSADTISVTGVSLNKNTMALTYASCDGNTYGNTTETLVATISPSNASNKGVSWSSNNTSVATVNTNGDVTAKSVGSATITATSEGNTSKKATCVVTVSAATVPTSTISLNKQSTTLTVNETETLTVIRTPSCASDTISWSSNNTTVATVSNGTITAKAAGTATITAKVGTNGPTADCAITVNAAIVPVTSVVMDCHEGSIVVGDQITLSATVYPANATDKTITWVQGQNPKGTISGNTFTATDTGVALISAQAGGVSSEQCGITIDPRPVSVEGISIDSCPGTIAQGLTNVYLTATIDPSDATNKNVTWSSSNSNIIAVEQTNDGRGHLIVKNTAGTATITVTTEDGNYEASCTITVPSTAIEFALGNQTSSGNKIYYTIGDNIDESEWSETWNSLNYGATTGTNPPLTISPGESLCITSENYPEDIQLEVNGTNRDDTNGFITMTYSELQQAAGYSNTYIVTFVREH